MQTALQFQWYECVAENNNDYEVHWIRKNETENERLETATRKTGFTKVKHHDEPYDYFAISV